MITTSIRLLKGYPWFKRLNAKVTYEILSKFIRSSDWHFMNYGYAPGSLTPALALLPQDEVNRYPIQLYHYMAAKTEIKNKEV